MRKVATWSTPTCAATSRRRSRSPTTTSSTSTRRSCACSLSGFGMTGPRVKEPGYDYILQGLAGWMDVTGEPDGPPTKSGLSLVDFSGGYVAAISLLAGVHAARRDGVGMDCDVVAVRHRHRDAQLPGDLAPQRGLRLRCDPPLGAPVAGAVPGLPDQGLAGSSSAARRRSSGSGSRRSSGTRSGSTTSGSPPSRRATRNRDVLIPLLEDESSRPAPSAEWLAAALRRVDPVRADQHRGEGFAEPHTVARGLDRRVRAPALRHGEASRYRRSASGRDAPTTVARRSATRTSTTSCAICSATTTSGSTRWSRPARSAIRAHARTCRRHRVHGLTAMVAGRSPRGSRTGPSGLRLDDVPDAGPARGPPAPARRGGLRDRLGPGRRRRRRRCAVAPGARRPAGGDRPRRPDAHVSAPAAALADGALVHGLDFDDTHAGGLVHATAVVLPAAFAVGRAGRGLGRRRCSPPRSSATRSCAGSPAASPHGFHARGLHATQVAGTLVRGGRGGPAAGARRRRPRSTRSASPGRRPAGCWSSSPPVRRRSSCTPDLPRSTGILAARLAAAGATGPATVLEGPHGIYAALSARAADPDARRRRAGRALGDHAHHHQALPVVPAHARHARRACARCSPLAPDDVDEIVADVHPDSASIVCEPAEVKVAPRTVLRRQVLAAVVGGGADRRRRRRRRDLRARLDRCAPRSRRCRAGCAPRSMDRRRRGGRCARPRRGAPARRHRAARAGSRAAPGGPDAPLSDDELARQVPRQLGGEPATRPRRGASSLARAVLTRSVDLAARDRAGSDHLGVPHDRARSRRSSPPSSRGTTTTATRSRSVCSSTGHAINSGHSGSAFDPAKGKPDVRRRHGRAGARPPTPSRRRSSRRSGSTLRRRHARRRERHDRRARRTTTRRGEVRERAVRHAPAHRASPSSSTGSCAARRSSRSRCTPSPGRRRGAACIGPDGSWRRETVRRGPRRRGLPADAAADRRRRRDRGAEGDIVGQYFYCLERAGELLEQAGLSLVAPRADHRLLHARDARALPEDRSRPPRPARPGLPRCSGHPDERAARPGRAAAPSTRSRRRYPPEPVNPGWSRYDTLTYIPGLRAGNTLYMSGFASLDMESQQATHAGDLRKQAEATYGAIARDAGRGRRDPGRPAHDGRVRHPGRPAGLPRRGGRAPRDPAPRPTRPRPASCAAACCATSSCSRSCPPR